MQSKSVKRSIKKRALALYYNGSVDNTNNNNSDDRQSLIKRNNMKNINKPTGYLIVIVFWLITTMMLSSCGLRFGDYHHYQKAHGKSVCNTN